MGHRSPPPPPPPPGSAIQNMFCSSRQAGNSLTVLIVGARRFDEAVQRAAHVLCSRASIIMRQQQRGPRFGDPSVAEKSYVRAMQLFSLILQCDLHPASNDTTTKVSYIPAYVLMERPRASHNAAYTGIVTASRLRTVTPDAAGLAYHNSGSGCSGCHRPGPDQVH